MMRLLLNQDGTGGGGTSAAAADWTTGFPDDAKPVIQAKGWKTPQEMFTSYRNLEKVLGDNYPKPDWDDKKYEDFYKRAGRPETPDKYELPMDALKDLPDVKLDEARVNKWRQNLHKLGLSDRQAKTLWSEYLKDEADGIKAQEQAAKNETEQAEMKLRNDWGNKFDDNLKAAKAALAKVAPGFDEFLNKSKLGNNPDLIKFFHTISTKISEDSATPGGQQNLGTTPEGATAEIQRLKGDKDFMANFQKGDKAAVARWNELHAAAHPKAG